jgi:hypothetical protein
MTIGGGALALGGLGAISGMLAGSFAPGIVTGFFALDGPEPPPTFNPVLWGVQQGFLTGLVCGAGGGMLVLLGLRCASWRPRMTTRRLMIIVGALALGMGLARWHLALGFGSLLTAIALVILARLPGLSPRRRVAAMAILALAFGLSWMIALIVRDAWEKAQDEHWVAWPIPSEEEYRRTLDGVPAEPHGIRPWWWPFGR